MGDYRELAKALLEELATVAQGEGYGCDSSWLRGYVAGVANAAAIALELEEGTSPPP